MGIYSTLSVSDSLSLGGPKTLIHLAIAGLTFCSRAVDLYLSISAPSSSYHTHGNINYIAAAKFIANRVALVTTKHASQIATAKSSPTIQAARAMPIKLSIFTPAPSTTSHLGLTIGFLAICTLLTVLAGAAVLRNTSSAVASGHTGETSTGTSISINQASTNNTHPSDIPSPRVGRRSGGSGGDEPFSSSDASDNIANDGDDFSQLHTSGRGDPPPPDGPPPPSPPTDDPEDDDNDMDDLWIMILKNMLTGVLVGLLIRGIRAFNRYRYFAAIRRAGKPEQEPTVAMPGKSLDTAAVSSNRSTSVSLYGILSVRASLSESVRLCQTTIAIAGFLSSDSSVQKFSSVSVPVVKSPVPSCNPRHGLQNMCFPRPKGASRPMDGALPTETTEPMSVPRRRPATHKLTDRETIESPIYTKATKDIFSLMIIICGLYFIVAVSIIPSLFLTTDSGSSLSEDPFNGAGQDQDIVDTSFVSLEAAEPPLMPETTSVEEVQTSASSQFTACARCKPEDLAPKDDLVEASIDTHDLCIVLDKFMPVHRNTCKVAPDASRIPSPVRPYHEPVPESQDVEQWSLPPIHPEPLELDNDKLANDVVKQPNGHEDLSSTFLAQAALPVSSTSLENAVDGEPSLGPDIGVSDSIVAKSEGLVAESTTAVLEIAAQCIGSASTQRDGLKVEDEPSAPGEEATYQLEAEVPVGSQEGEDVFSEGVQMERESISTWPLETATEADVSVGTMPVDYTPVDDTPVGDTSLPPALPSAVSPPPVSPAPPESHPPSRLSLPNPSTPSAEAGPSSATSRSRRTQRHCDNSASGIDSRRTSSNAGYDPFALESTFMPRIHLGEKLSRRGRRGKKKKPSSSAGDDHSESTETSHFPDVDAGGLQSQQTAIQDNGTVLVREDERPKPDALLAALEPVRVQNKGKGKEKDPSEYPVAGPLTADGARLLRMQTGDQNQNGGSGSPGNRNEKKTEKKNENNRTGQQDRDSQATGSGSSTKTPSSPCADPTETSFPPHTSTRRGGKGKRKEKHQKVPQSWVAGPSTVASLPRHGKRRRLEQSAAENLERSRTDIRGSSLLDSIHAPRPALPSNHPRSNPFLHPDLAATVPYASPGGIPISQFNEPRMVQLDTPTWTATTYQPMQPTPTHASSLPHGLTYPGETSSPLSPRLPARTMELDYRVEPRRRPVQSRSPSLTPESQVRLDSSDRSPRRRSSFSNNFRFARQVTVPWEEEAEAYDSLEPQRPPSPDRPRGSADSCWAPHNTAEF